MTQVKKTRLKRRQGNSDRLFLVIRSLARKQQGNAPKVFLSLRAAARRFNVPVSAMASVYRKLSDEGMLISIRGSQTLLQKRGPLRTLKARGVIAMPVSISRFQVLNDYRRCLLILRDELRERGFLVSTIFCEHAVAAGRGLIAAFRKERVDVAVWLLPDSADRETVLQLKDAGIRFVGINITPLSGMQTRYQIGRKQAIRAIIQAWRADPRLSGTTIIQLAREAKSDQERLIRLRALVESEGMECRIAKVLVANLSAFLSSVCQEKHNGVILPAAPATLLGWHAPETLSTVLGSCRVALIDGPIDLPYADAPINATVDLVTASWLPIVKRIASDITKGAAFEDGEQIIFQAKPYLGVSLAQYHSPIA